MKLPEIILASASPRRAELLLQIGVSFQLLPAHIDESVKANETGIAHVVRLAREKARAAARLAQQQGLLLPVLGADTIVELDAEILGKPADRAQAGAMLQKLSARTHRVHTALCLICAGAETAVLSSSEVEFAELSPAEIERYVASEEPLDKAGGYAIQGAAAAFIKNLRGSYSGVMGLPLYEVAELLKTCETLRSS
jgi:septum formation protein